MRAERGLHLSRTTIMRWVQRYTPALVKRRTRLARKVGRSWRVDETYLKVRGRDVSISRTKLSLQSGMRYSVRSLLPDGLVVPLLHISTRAPDSISLHDSHSSLGNKSAFHGLTQKNLCSSHFSIARQIKSG